MATLRDGLQDDWRIFDNTITLTLVRRTGQEVDFDLQNLSSTTTTEECEGCLIRQISKRETGSVRQVFERGKSITADNYQLSDTAVEVPLKEGRVIKIDDQLHAPDGRKWKILAIDYATLNTRYRLGCRTL